MVKPIANLREVGFTDIEDNGYYTSRRAQFSDGIGAKKLGYNLTGLPPGKAQCCDRESNESPQGSDAMPRTPT